MIYECNVIIDLNIFGKMEKRKEEELNLEEDEEIKEEIGFDEEEGPENSEDFVEKEFSIESKGSGNYDDDFFDTVVGCMQDIIFDHSFTDFQNKFFGSYYKEFDNSEENKLIYTEIFQKYKSTIETYIEQVKFKLN